MALSDFTGWITQAARNVGIDPALFSRVLQTESSGNPLAVSPAGAIGLGQIMPSTANAYGYSAASLYNPQTNISLSAQILADNINRYGTVGGVAAYNGGTLAGQAVAAGGSPPSQETRDYLKKIFGNDPTSPISQGGSLINNALDLLIPGSGTLVGGAEAATSAGSKIAPATVNSWLGRGAILVLGLVLVLIALFVMAKGPEVVMKTIAP